MGAEDGGEGTEEEALHQGEEGAHVFARGSVALGGPVLGEAEISVSVEGEVVRCARGIDGCEKTKRRGKQPETKAIFLVRIPTSG